MGRRYTDDERYRAIWMAAQAETMEIGCQQAGVSVKTVQNWLQQEHWRSFYDASRKTNPKNQWYQLMPVLNRLYERLRQAAWDRHPPDEVRPILEDLVERALSAREQIPDHNKQAKRIRRFVNRAADEICGQLVDVRSGQLTTILDQISKVNAVLRQVSVDGAPEDVPQAPGDDPLGLGK